jgi:hypothetical protein
VIPRPADTVTLLPALVGRFGTRLPSGDVSGRHINDVIEPVCRAGDDAVAALPRHRWLSVLQTYAPERMATDPVGWVVR